MFTKRTHRQPDPRQDPAEQHRRGATRSGNGTPYAEGLVAFEPSANVVVMIERAAGDDDRRTEALQRPGADQEPARLRKAAQRARPQRTGGGRG